VSKYGCPSHDKEPVDCSEVSEVLKRKDYKKQALIFHPDKNKKCVEDATLKFQALQNNSTCKVD
jgi:hypothetical protein